jgi:surface antigen
MLRRLCVPLLLLAPLLLMSAWTPWQTGQTWVNGSWFCRALSPTAYHCTQHWHHAGSQIISDNPAWVPNGPVAASAPAPARPATFATHSANTYPFGQCTWGAAALASDNVNGLGNARDWLGAAAGRGLPTGSSPRVGATVVYAPGVQGASSLGHVAHVVALLPGGRFVVEEMNYYGYGGGWGRFSYRTSWVGWGVTFIY